MPGTKPPLWRKPSMWRPASWNGSWGVNCAPFRSRGSPRDLSLTLLGTNSFHYPAICAPTCIDTLGPRNQNTRLVFAEGYPSGQREQTVNLPAYAFVGSNPTPSTTTAGVGSGRVRGQR